MAKRKNKLTRKIKGKTFTANNTQRPRTASKKIARNIRKKELREVRVIKTNQGSLKKSGFNRFSVFVGPKRKKK